MGAVEHDPSARVAALRAAVLAGRGPGASEQEIADHTRDRPWLGAVPAPLERALVARQADRVRAVEPIASHRARSQARYVTCRAALVGAAAALLIRSIGSRLVRARHPRRG